MFKKVQANSRYYCIVSIIVLMTSCNTRQAVPFAEKETGLTAPHMRSFQLPAASKIKWIAGKTDSIPQPVIKSFDIDKIPSKPFYADGFKPFSKPVQQEKIDWANLPSKPFNAGTVPAKQMVYTTIKINPPLRIKAGIPRTKSPVIKNIVHFGLEEGLPSSSVQQIFQDKKGIYWIMTNRGLCRYDGEYMDLFSFISKEPQGAPEVLAIFEDNAGKLWLRSASRGVYIFDYENGLVKNFANKWYNFCPDEAGNIWAISNKEISIIDPQKLTEKIIPSTLVSDAGEVARVIKGGQQQLLFRTGEGISLLDQQQHTIRQWHAAGIKDYNRMFYFLRTRSGNIMMANHDGIDIIKPDSGYCTTPDQ